MKNVLFISYEFPPKINIGSLQACTYARYLQNFGWNPHVLTVKKGGFREPVDELLMNKIPSEVQITRTGYLEVRQPSLLFRKFPESRLTHALIRLWDNLPPDEQIGWLPFAYFQAMRIIRSQQIDAIYTLSGPYTSHLIGYLLKKKTGLPWATHFGDEWTQNPNRLYPLALQRKLDAMLEQWTLNSADQIVLAWPGMVSLFPIDISTKSSTVTLSFDETDFQTLSNKKRTDKFCITYTGSLYNYRKTANFLRAMEDLLSEKQLAIDRVELLFMGQARRVAFSGFENSLAAKVIRCVGLLPHCQVFDHLKQASVLLLIMDQLDRAKHCIQGKTFEYIASGRPIIALGPHDGATSDLIRRTKTGIVVGYEDVEGIKKAVLDMYTNWENGELSIEPDWQEVGRHEAKEVTKELAQVLDRITGRQT